MHGMWAQGAAKAEDEEVRLAPTVSMGVEQWWADGLWFVGWCNLRRGDNMRLGNRARDQSFLSAEF